MAGRDSASAACATVCKQIQESLQESVVQGVNISASWETAKVKADPTSTPINDASLQVTPKANIPELSSF